MSSQAKTESKLAEKINFIHTQAVEKHKQGDLTAAVDFYVQAIKLERSQPAWVYGNAITLLNQLGKVNQALEVGKIALNIDANNAEILRALGCVYKSSGNLPNSIKFYQQAIKMEANQPVWVYEHLVENLIQANDFPQAINYGKQGTQIDPRSCWLKYHLGNAFSEQSMWQEACEQYIQILEIEPDFLNVADKLNEAASHQVNKISQTSTKLLEKSELKDATSSCSLELESKIIKTSSSFAAAITRVELGGYIQGWAIDNSRPDAPLEMKVLVDDQPISIVKSNQATIAAPTENLAGQPQGFRVQIPVTLMDDHEHKFELINLPDQQSLITLVKVPPRGAGRINGCKDSYLSGWALSDGHSADAVALDIYIDHVFYTEIQADQPKSDLLKYGLGDGNNGFKVFLPLLPREAPYQIDVCFQGTKSHLQKSPIFVEQSSSEENNQGSQPLFLAGLAEIASGGVMTGWAIDNIEPERKLKLKLYADGSPIGVAKALQNLSELDIELNLEMCAASPKKFKVQLPFTLLDNQLHQFQIALLDDQQKELQSITFRALVPRQQTGRVDGWNDNCVTGWALPEGHFGSPTRLDVYIDGTFYQEIRANASRQDLLKHNLGNGNNGFEFALPFPPENKRTYEVEVYFAGTEQKLQRSPIKIDFEAIALLENQQQGRFSLLYRDKSSAPSREITIVIPVYNAYEELCQCLKSVFKHTSLATKLIIINDCSSDTRIPDLLVWAGSHPHVTVLTNETNIGYTRTINRGINLAENDDIVLLNSDTEVGPHWLQNLRSAVYHQPDIATATAISDNSGAFSVPTVGQANDFPIWLGSEEMVRAVSQNSKIIYPETPTGSGFCIYIRREVMEEIGIFDEVNFPRGYGEENDFCMRAVRSGWRNIVDDRTLVYHVRSASFRDEKVKLYDTGRGVVDERFPDYRGRVGVFVHSPQMNTMRYRIRKLIEGKHPALNHQPQQRVLYVISTQTGGTPQTNQDLMSGLSDRYHPLVLRCDATQIFLYDTRDKPDIPIEHTKLRSPITLTAHQSTEYEDIVGDWLVKHSIEILHVRHIAWHSLSLCRVAKQLGITVIFSFHDFYAVCPTVNLLDEEQIFCQGNCTSSEADCKIPLWRKHNHVPKLKHSFINAWREMIAQVFPHIDTFVTTSASTKSLLIDIYPELEQRDFEVIPHGRDFVQLAAQKNSFAVSHPVASEPLRILFPGNIQTAKGAELIAQLKALDLENRLEFHFLGTKADILDESVGKYHGRYQRQNFSKLVKQIKPHYIGIFSIWPETYCHTLTESWASGIPVIAIALGAVAERVQHHGGGWLIEPNLSAEAVYAKLLQVASSSGDYMNKIGEVNQWQLSYGRQNTIATMAQKYHRLYQRVQQATLPFKLPDEQLGQSSSTRVGVFVRRDAQGKSTPSTHVRVLEWLKCYEVAQKLDAQLLDIDSFLYDSRETLDLDMVLVQRNTIPPHLTRQFIEQCQSRSLPIVFEIDDDLTNVPAAKDPTGIYAQTAVGIKAIAQAASTVIVSTEPLKVQMSQYSSSVVVIPNAIPRYSWFKPLSTQSKKAKVLLKDNQDAPEFRVIYMGNPTHAEDMAMVRPVFADLANKGHPVQLYVIGGEAPKEDDEPTWYQRINVPEQYSHYPEFVAWFRHLAPEFNLAIAPLVKTEFNQCKSPLKFLQYAAVGLPCIASNCTPYQEVIESGINGILVDNHESAWSNAIVESVNNQSELAQIGSNAQELILERHLMSNYADAYLSIFNHSSIRQ